MTKFTKRLSMLFIIWLTLFSSILVSASELSSNDFWVLEIDDKAVNDNKSYYFTWLGCASCLMVEEDADLSQFEKLPLIARPDWRAAAKVQIALQMLSVEPEIQSQFFKEIKNSNVDIKSIEAMSGLLVSLGVDQEILTETLTSKALFKKVAEAEQIAEHYNIRYVPTVVVRGKYATDAEHAGSVANFGQIIKQLSVKN